LEEILKDLIPKHFYHGDNHPTVSTVGELREVLAELPNNLRVEAGFSKCAMLVVYNIASDPHLEIEEGDDDEDEDE
jgi:hypothetical protein